MQPSPLSNFRIFSSPNPNPRKKPFSNNFPFTRAPFLSLGFAIVDTLYKWSYINVFFWDSLFSFSMFSCWIIFYCVYTHIYRHILLTHLQLMNISRHFLIIMNNVSINIHVQVLAWTNVFSSLGVNLGVKLLGLCLTFWGTDCFLK